VLVLRTLLNGFNVTIELEREMRVQRIRQCGNDELRLKLGRQGRRWVFLSVTGVRAGNFFVQEKMVE
jgi:hypothetical protein